MDENQRKSSNNQDVPDKYIIVPVEDIIPDISPLEKEIERTLVQKRLDDANGGLDSAASYSRDLYNVMKKNEFDTKYTDDPFRDQIIQVKNTLNLFRGQTVVDLGAGMTPFAYHMVEAVQAKAYVAVEPMYYGMLKGRFTDGDFLGASFIYSGAKLPGTHKKIPIAIVPEDALTFLERLPDNSVSILTCGIERFAIIDSIDYESSVEREISRVLNPTGVYISYDSCFVPQGLKLKTEKPYREFLKIFFKDIQI